MSASGSSPRGAYDFVVVGAFRYPAEDASSNRMLALAKAARSIGHRPLVVNDTPPLDGGPLGEVRTFGGIDYISTGPMAAFRVARLLARVGRPLRLVRAIRHVGYERNATYAIVSSGLYTPGVHIALKWLLQMTTITDVVERHDPQQFTTGRRSPQFLRHRWTSLLSRILPDGVIAVSRTLEATYRTTRPVLRVPPLVDIDEFPAPMRRPPHGPLTLLYSGTPTRKDQLGALVDAVLDDRGGGRPVRLLIAGADATQLAVSEDVGPQRVARFGESVTTLGRLPRSEVIQQLHRADFSVLLRPLDGYAQAGFPSKVPESLAAGCPVLGNLTSDLSDYLKDGTNALVCGPDPTTRTVPPAALREALARATSMTDDQLFQMKQAARSSAEGLHYATWGPILGRWLRMLNA